MADDPPASGRVSRRRLLVAGGFGAASWAVLRELPSSEEAATARTGPAGSTTTTTTVRVREPVAPATVDGAPDPPPPDHTYDLTITGGRVIDPDSGFDGTADVGIDGGTIAAIVPDPDQPLTGRQRIDARGLVVAPGFIDVLSYEPNDYGVWFKVADGVTTNLGMHGINATADDFFATYEGRVPIHFGGAFDNPYMRWTFTSLRDGTEAYPSHIDQLADLCRSGFESGWLGVDLEPEYTPGVSRDEIIALAAVAAEYGRPVFFHARYSEPDQNLEGVDEILAVAREAGVAVHIDHITSTGGTGTMVETLARLEAARAEGIDVTACLYPYDFWATTLQAPRYGPDPVTGAPVTERYGVDWGDLVIAGTGEALTEARYNELRAAGENPLVAALHTIPEEEIRLALEADFTMIGSDAIPEPGDNNHPRASGCFARTLGTYVRDRKVLSLEAALAKMTIIPARRLEAACSAFTRKGRIQRGADADITVFDPATVADRSTIEAPATESAGIEAVVVAGQVILDDDGLHRDRLVGQALKGGT